MIKATYGGQTYDNVSSLVATDGTNNATVTLMESGTIPTPTGTKTITENGTGIDVTNYAMVDVSVSGGGGSTNIETGTYTITAEDVTAKKFSITLQNAADVVIVFPTTDAPSSRSTRTAFYYECWSAAFMKRIGSTSTSVTALTNQQNGLSAPVTTSHLIQVEGQSRSNGCYMDGLTAHFSNINDSMYAGPVNYIALRGLV